MEMSTQANKKRHRGLHKRARSTLDMTQRFAQTAADNKKNSNTSRGASNSTNEDEDAAKSESGCEVLVVVVDVVVDVVVVVVVKPRILSKAVVVLLAMHGSDAVNVTLTDRPPMHAWSRSALFTSKS